MPVKRPPISLCILISTLLLSLTGLPVVAQTQNNNSVFSELPSTQNTTAKQKNQINSARTYGERLQIKKTLSNAPKKNARTTLGPGLGQKKPRAAGATRQTQPRAFGPRDRVRAQGNRRGDRPTR